MSLNVVGIRSNRLTMSVNDLPCLTQRNLTGREAVGRGRDSSCSDVTGFWLSDFAASARQGSHTPSPMSWRCIATTRMLQGLVRNGLEFAPCCCAVVGSNSALGWWRGRRSPSSPWNRFSLKDVGGPYVHGDQFVVPLHDGRHAQRRKAHAHGRGRPVRGEGRQDLRGAVLLQRLRPATCAANKNKGSRSAPFVFTFRSCR